MNGGVTQPEVPRLGVVTVTSFNKLNGAVGVVVSGIGVDRADLPTVFDDRLIDVILARISRRWRGANPGVLVIPVATVARVCSCVPLTNLPRGLAILFKVPGPKLHFIGIVFGTRVLTDHVKAGDVVLLKTG